LPPYYFSTRKLSLLYAVLFLRYNTALACAKMFFIINKVTKTHNRE